MKSIAIVLGLLVAGVSFSQTTMKRKEHNEKLTPAQRVEKHTERMTKTLDLNKEQQTKVAALNAEMGKTKMAHKEKMKALKAEMKKSREAYKTNLNQILTAEQKEKLNKLEAEKKAKREACKNDANCKSKKAEGRKHRTNKDRTLPVK